MSASIIGHPRLRKKRIYIYTHMCECVCVCVCVCVHIYDICCFQIFCLCIWEIAESSWGKKLTRNKLEQVSWIGSFHMKKPELPTENI